ncbi:MAG: hypothetical protein AMXMBFR20_07080 [Planctomycetia bacterium]
MDNEKEKSDVAGDALKREPAVVHIGIGAGVELGGHGDANAVKGVESEGQEYETYFQRKEIRQIVDPVNFLVEDFATSFEKAKPVEGPRVGQEVLNEEGADRDDAAERMEFSEQKMMLLLKG